jgi:hypothetical protein
VSDYTPHSAEEAARLLLGLGPDDEGTETLDRVRELRTKAAAFDALQAELDAAHGALHAALKTPEGVTLKLDGMRRRPRTSSPARRRARCLRRARGLAGRFDECDARQARSRYAGKPPAKEERRWVPLRRVMADKPHHLLLKASLGSIGVWRLDDNGEEVVQVGSAGPRDSRLVCP